MKESIRPEMKLSEVIESFPETRAVFEAHGLGKLVSDESLEAIGSFLTLETALSTHGVATDLFMNLLTEGGHGDSAPGRANGPATLMSLMPCGLKVPFARDFEAFMASVIDGGGLPMTCFLESNLNHDISYYTYVSHMETVDDLPDVVVSSDFNAFFHRRFYTRFVQKKCFATVMEGINTSPVFQNAGITDPEGHYGILCVNPLIMVADRRACGDRPLPKTWKDLLDPVWKRSITLRGNEHFFCHAVLLPVYKEYGPGAVKALASNIYDGRHPSQMVKTAGSGKSAALYVMPYFFAKKIPAGKPVSLIWPEDGALASPVTLLVKSSKADELRHVTDYLMGEKLAKVFAGAGFPSFHPAVNDDLPPDAGLKWVGWDYIRGNDIEQQNEEIDRILFPVLNERGAS